jgi:hypothetical protein
MNRSSVPLVLFVATCLALRCLPGALPLGAEKTKAKTRAAPATVQVTSPNGGEEWRRGETRQITWTTSSYTGRVRIELLLNDVVAGTIAAEVPATPGSYAWTVGRLADGSFRTGPNFKVRVRAIDVPLPGSNAYGVVPAGMPGRLAVGLTSGPGDTWMRDSLVSWDMRYQYFTYGWKNNWGWDPTNSGQWGLSYLNECHTQGFMPVVQYYCMNGYSGYNESAFYATTQNVGIMTTYFNDFKTLMERCKDYGNPVLVLMEGDGYAYMEIQSGNNPDAYSAIAATGIPELQGLPNTAAGWGLAFLKLRKDVGATNVILGMHISGWATGKDIAYYQANVPLQPEVDTAYAFLRKLGLETNVTGDTYDVLVGDPLDRDSGYYEVHEGQGQARWWDASDSAPITTRSFNRYAEWLRLWNIKAQKRWVLWQIPVGNSNHLNVDNDKTTPRFGYKDNRPEYFFLDSTAHLVKFADVGVISLLFGPGEGHQSVYKNDQYNDGQLFMKSRAGAFLNAGGLPISTGSAK